MPFQIIRNDITKVQADAIVNTANPLPQIGAGTDSAIYRAAGEKELLDERRTIGEIAPGQAAYTKAYALKAKYIIHTVGPAWWGGDRGEREILHSCYEKSLQMAADLGCNSIAFPLIASGSYDFPKGEALQIALEEIGKFLLTHEMKIILTVFDIDSFELSGRLMGNITEYIDEHYVRETRRKEYPRPERYSLRKNYLRHLSESESLHEDSMSFEHDMESPAFAGRAAARNAPSAPAVKEDSFSALSGKSLEEIMKSREDTFQQRLFKLIDESGLDDVTVYKRANIDRKVFSRIRCNKNYTPKKKTAVAFAIALHLDMPAMLDLLSRAEIAFSPSSKFDLIITYFVTNRIYDIFEINCALFKYGQPTLE